MTQINTDVDAAAAVLRRGGLVGLPTETVYGLAADALNPAAVNRVFAAKGRPSSHPLIVHVAGADAAEFWAREVPDRVYPLLARWWPGPLTVLLPRSEHVLDEVTGGRDTVALRAPAHPMAQALLEAFGSGLVAPSANRFGRVSPTTAKDVVTELGSAVNLVLDGGPCEIGIESTLVDLTGDQALILRVGHVTAKELREHLPDVEVVSTAVPAVAPGMLAAHYAPDARVVVLSPEAGQIEVEAAAAPYLATGQTVGLLGPELLDLGKGAQMGQLSYLPIIQLEPAGEPEDYARVLYGRLRQADEQNLDILIVIPPPSVGSGIAVADRLRRAAAHRKPA